MHVNWLEVLTGLASWIRLFFRWVFKSRLETTQRATESMESAKYLLLQMSRGSRGENELKEESVALLRVYALFGFLEFAEWLTKVTIVFLLLTKCFDFAHTIFTRKREGDDE